MRIVIVGESRELRENTELRDHWRFFVSRARQGYLVIARFDIRRKKSKRKRLLYEFLRKHGFRVETSNPKQTVPAKTIVKSARGVVRFYNDLLRLQTLDFNIMYDLADEYFAVLRSLKRVVDAFTLDAEYKLALIEKYLREGYSLIVNSYLPELTYDVENVELLTSIYGVVKVYKDERKVLIEESVAKRLRVCRG